MDIRTEKERESEPRMECRMQALACQLPETTASLDRKHSGLLRHRQNGHKALCTASICGLKLILHLCNAI
uniref:Uncharacterized protein n=1 Tax=Anguilla anguilla TaxID=7936 RepID=A0A0E9VDX2_ANGAN